VREKAGGGNKCIYLHQHSIKKIKQHVLREERWID
jgi:hypothetical protein